MYAPNSLYDKGWYLLRLQLKELINEHGIYEFNENTVTTVVTGLLAKSNSIKDCYRIHEVLTEEFEQTPDVARLTTHADLRTVFERCTNLIAILRKDCIQPLVGNSLVVNNAPPQPKVQIQAQIPYF